MSAHLRELFSSSRASAVSSSSFIPTLESLSLPELDGVRAVLCLLMICYHSQAFMWPHVTAADGQLLFDHWSVWLLPIGPVIVDWFFVLTGLLTALPLMQQEKKEMRALKDEGAKQHDSATAVNGKEEKELLQSSATPLSSSSASASTAPSGSGLSSRAPARTFSVTAFWYRRFSRFVPMWLLVYSVHHLLLQPVTVLPRSAMRNELMAGLLDSIPAEQQLPDAYPSLCSRLEFLPLQLTFAQHFLPFGGCQGVTWSLGVQMQFYLLFPLLWSRLLRSSSRAGLLSGKQWSPSFKLVLVMCGVIAVTVVMRVAAFFHSCTAPMWHVEGAMVFFFWYSSSWTRMGAIAAGVVLAYICTYCPQCSLWLRRSPLMRYGLLLLHCVLLLLVRLSLIMHVEGPGLSIASSAQHRLPMMELKEQQFPPSLHQLRQLPAYLSHLVMHALLQVGSPVMFACISVFLLCLLHRVDGFFSRLNRLLSSSLLAPIATLSYIAYLLHPSVEAQLYLLYTTRFQPHWTPTPPVFAAATALMLLVTLSLAAVLHVTLDKPVQAWLSIPRIQAAAMRWSTRYAALCLTVSAVCHLLLTPGILFAYRPSHDALYSP